MKSIAPIFIIITTLSLTACELQQVNKIDIPTADSTARRTSSPLDLMKARLLNHTYIYCDDLGSGSDERQYKFTAPFNLEETIIHHSDTQDCTSSLTSSDVMTYTITAVEASTEVPVVAPIYANYKFSLSDGIDSSERILDIDPDGFFVVEVRDILCGVMDRCVTRPGNAIYNGTHYEDPAITSLKTNLTNKTYEVCEIVNGTNSRKFSVSFEQNSDFVVHSITETDFADTTCTMQGFDYSLGDENKSVTAISSIGIDTYRFSTNSGNIPLVIASDYSSIEITVQSTCPPSPARCGPIVVYQLTLPKI